jgi:hypothetical protein
MDFSISNPISSIIDTVGKIIDKAVPDRAAADAAKAQLLSQESTQEFQLLLGQIQANIEEAKSTNWWVAGWRPAVGWCCVTALAVQFIITPLGAAMGFKIPPLDTGPLITMLVSLLGIAGMRTAEKITGSEGKR